MSPFLVPVEVELGELPLIMRVSWVGAQIHDANSRGSTRGLQRGSKGNGRAVDTELLGLGKDGDSRRILLDDVNLEALASGPASGRTIHGSRTIGGGDILLQQNVGIRIYNLKGPKQWCGNSAGRG